MIKSKALSLTLSAAMIVSVAGLAGCGYNKDGNTTRTNNVSMKNNSRIGGNMLNNYSTNNNNGTQHDLTNLKYSKTLSEKISKIKGVRDAHVFVTKNNAYVSLALHGQAKNQVTPNATGNMRSMSTDGVDGNMLGMNGTTRRHDGVYGNSATGSAGLLRGMSDPRGTLDNNTGLGTSAGTGRMGVRGYSNGGFNGTGYNTMGDTTSGTGLMGMNGARSLNRTDGRYGMMSNTTGTGNTAYENSVPKHIRDEISSKIQKTVPTVKEVYCSSDAGFYEHSMRYRGQNIDGVGNVANKAGNVANRTGNVVTNTVGTLAHDMGTWINRIFPLNMGRDGVRTNNINNNGMFNNNGQKDGLFDMNHRDNR